MPILIKNESFNNIFLWKLCFIENYCCPVKLFQTKQIRADTSHEVSALLVIFVLRKNI